MSDAKTTNDQLHKLLYQHEMGAVDKTQYRQLRARLIDGFADTQSNKTNTRIRQDNAKNQPNYTERSSAFTLVLTVLLVLAATLLLVYSFTGSSTAPPQAKVSPPTLAEEK